MAQELDQYFQMQDDYYMFKGWNDINYFNSKLKVYNRMITNIENEIKIADILNEVKSRCYDVIEDACLQVSINTLPSFTTNLRQAAEFISDFTYDSDEDILEVSSDDKTNEDSTISWLSETCDSIISASEFVHNNSINSKKNCDRYSTVIEKTEANDSENSFENPSSPVIENTEANDSGNSVQNLSSPVNENTEANDSGNSVENSSSPVNENTEANDSGNSVENPSSPVNENTEGNDSGNSVENPSSPVIENTKANDSDNSPENLSSINPPALRNNKLAKQPVVLLNPLNISGIHENTSININTFYNDNLKNQCFNIVETSQTKNNQSLTLDSNCKKTKLKTVLNSHSKNYHDKKVTERQDDENPQRSCTSGSEMDAKEILIESHICKKPRSIFDFESKRESLKAIRKTADDLKILSTLERNFICSYCEKAFLQKNTMKNHIFICPKRNDGGNYIKPKKKIVHKIRYECKLCQTTYASKAIFTKHNENTHNLRRPYRCLVCGWGFFNEKALQHHCSIRHGLSGTNQYKCPYCVDSFNRRADLNYHCRKYHGGSKTYVCTICLKSFIDESVWKLHEENHGHRCDVCTFVTQSESEMVVHRCTHLQLVTYKCEICSRTFGKKASFTKHIQVHERERKQ